MNYENTEDLENQDVVDEGLTEAEEAQGPDNITSKSVIIEGTSNTTINLYF